MNNKKQAIKIALLCNMNNNYFSLVRYLRDSGFDAELLLFDDEEAHFKPMCDTYNLNYMTYVKKLQWGQERKVLTTTAARIRSDLQQYDILIGQGRAPAYVAKAGLKLDIFSPYGGDVVLATKFRPTNPLFLLHHIYAVYMQRRGLKDHCKIHNSLYFDVHEKIYEKFLPLSKRWYVGMPMVYCREYDSLSLEQVSQRSHWGHIASELRKNYQLLILYHGRHSTSGTNKASVKGSDILIYGLKRFVDVRADVKVKLLTLEYGPNVNEIKLLINKLSLTEYVQWFPTMYRKDIMALLGYVDVACGPFTFSILFNGTISECVASGTAIMTKRNNNDDIQQGYYNELYPVLNASCPDEVCSQLSFCADNPKNLNEVGVRSKVWYQQKLVKSSLTKYEDYIEGRAREINQAARLC